VRREDVVGEGLRLIDRTPGGDDEEAAESGPEVAGVGFIRAVPHLAPECADLGLERVVITGDAEERVGNRHANGVDLLVLALLLNGVAQGPQDCDGNQHAPSNKPLLATDLR